jgi:hypothetical protein
MLTPLIKCYSTPFLVDFEGTLQSNGSAQLKGTKVFCLDVAPAGAYWSMQISNTRESSMDTIAATTTLGRMMVNVFDGTRKAYSDPKPQLLISIIDGNQHVLSRDFHENSSTFFTNLPVVGNFTDNCSVLASAKGYKDAGFAPVKIIANTVQIVNLMLLPSSNELNFGAATWEILGAKRPTTRSILGADLNDSAAAASRYGDLKEVQRGEVLACLLNILTAAEQAFLPQGTPLCYLKALIFDREGDSAMARDRFFGWADPNIIQQLEASKAQGLFTNAPSILHKGATRSYKQTQFGEANLQLTFHEHDHKTIGGLDCIKIEFDIDYFRDAGAHLLLEVAVNALGSVTDPRAVFALRWMVGARAGIPEFDPLYTIQKA